MASSESRREASTGGHGLGIELRNELDSLPCPAYGSVPQPPEYSSYVDKCLTLSNFISWTASAGICRTEINEPSNKADFVAK